MIGEQAIFNLEIKKKRGLSINPDIHHSKVFSSVKFSNPFIFVTQCLWSIFQTIDYLI